MKTSIASIILLCLLSNPFPYSGQMYYLDFVPSIPQHNIYSCAAALNQAIFAYYLAETNATVPSLQTICRMAIGGAEDCDGTVIPLVHTGFPQQYDCRESIQCSYGNKCDRGILSTKRIGASYENGPIDYSEMLTNIKCGRPMLAVTVVGDMPHQVAITGAGSIPNFSNNCTEHMNPWPPIDMQYPEPADFQEEREGWDYRWIMDYDKFKSYYWDWTETLIVASPYIPAVETYVSGKDKTLYPVKFSNGMYIPYPIHCEGDFVMDAINFKMECAGGWNRVSWPHYQDLD